MIVMKHHFKFLHLLQSIRGQVTISCKEDSIPHLTAYLFLLLHLKYHISVTYSCPTIVQARQVATKGKKGIKSNRRQIY
jgi:hypothetical protein